MMISRDTLNAIFMFYILLIAQLLPTIYNNVRKFFTTADLNTSLCERSSTVNNNRTNAENCRRWRRTTPGQFIRVYKNAAQWGQSRFHRGDDCLSVCLYWWTIDLMRFYITSSRRSRFQTLSFSFMTKRCVVFKELWVDTIFFPFIILAAT